jgi:hypothetical protein
MMKRNVISKTLVGSLLLASLALTGCGSAAPGAIEDPYLEDPGYTDPAYGGGTTTPGYTDPGYGGNTGGVTDPGMGYGNELTASVIKIKNGSFMGAGKCVATVEVMNPGQQQLSGTLTVTFTNKGKPTKNVTSQQVTIGPGESQTFTFEDKKWSTDNATAEVTTDTPVATGGGYGSNTGAYGSNTGYGNTTGTGTGYAY